MDQAKQNQGLKSLQSLNEPYLAACTTLTLHGLDVHPEEKDACNPHKTGLADLADMGIIVLLVLSGACFPACS
jgi:hypothetical protein